MTLNHTILTEGEQEQLKRQAWQTVVQARQALAIYVDAAASSGRWDDDVIDASSLHVHIENFDYRYERHP